MKKTQIFYIFIIFIISIIFFIILYEFFKSIKNYDCDIINCKIIVNEITKNIPRLKKYIDNNNFAKIISNIILDCRKDTGCHSNISSLNGDDWNELFIKINYLLEINNKSLLNLYEKNIIIKILELKWYKI